MLKARINKVSGIALSEFKFSFSLQISVNNENESINPFTMISGFFKDFQLINLKQKTLNRIGLNSVCISLTRFTFSKLNRKATKLKESQLKENNKITTSHLMAMGWRLKLMERSRIEKSIATSALQKSKSCILTSIVKD